MICAEPVPRFQYTITTEMTYHASHAALLALIKRVPTLDGARPLESQLHVVNFPGPAAFESDDAPREAFVDIKRLFTSDWVLTNNRML